MSLTATATDGDPGTIFSFGLVGTPTGASIDPLTGAFTWTPTAHQGSKAHPFSVMVRDHDLPQPCDDEQITVTVCVKPIAFDQTLATGEDVALPISLTASDEGSTTFTWVIVDAADHGLLSGTRPAITCTPAANYFGADSFTCAVHDGTDDSNIATIRITIRPIIDALEANPLPVTTSMNTVQEITLSGSEGEGVPGEWIFVAQPLPGSLIHINFKCTYRPEARNIGADLFTLRIDATQVDSK